MRALIQRVSRAKVTEGEKTLGKIEKGFLILLGVASTDTEADIDFFVEKISNLRVFEDVEGKMNLSLVDIKGSVLIVSQFTLYADCKKGRRPSFIDAASPQIAEEMYKKFIQKFRQTLIPVGEGRFGAMMDIELVNSGPVTIMLDSKELR